MHRSGTKVVYHIEGGALALLVVPGSMFAMVSFIHFFPTLSVIVGGILQIFVFVGCIIDGATKRAQDLKSVHTAPVAFAPSLLTVARRILPRRIAEEDVGDAIEAIREMREENASRHQVCLTIARTIVHVAYATLVYIFAPRLPTAEGDRAALHDLLLDLFDGDELRLFLWRMKGGADLIRDLPDRSGLSPRVWFGLVIESMERRGLVDEVFFDRLRAERPLRRDEVAKVRKTWTRR